MYEYPSKIQCRVPRRINIIEGASSLIDNRMLFNSDTFGKINLERDIKLPKMGAWN
ncbi:MAG: hypothetical protein CM15mP111_0980 [Hyphomicrobiales bacterium]|nr:MAG: hypothetical protein CM15mP111_0980 [Hyphomicrobiales bacterium]